MSKTIIFAMLFSVSYGQAESCQLSFEKPIEALKKIVFDSNQLKANYNGSAFSTTHILDITYQGKPILTFSNKTVSEIAIIASYIPEEFPTLRRAFEETFKNLSFKLWLMAKSHPSVQIDLSKFTMRIDSMGRCSAALVSLDKVFFESPLHHSLLE